MIDINQLKNTYNKNTINKTIIYKHDKRKDVPDLWVVGEASPIGAFFRNNIITRILNATHCKTKKVVLDLWVVGEASPIDATFKNIQ